MRYVGIEGAKESHLLVVYARHLERQRARKRVTPEVIGLAGLRSVSMRRDPIFGMFSVQMTASAWKLRTKRGTGRKSRASMQGGRSAGMGRSLDRRDPLEVGTLRKRRKGLDTPPAKRATSDA